jgi:uncharacterized protein with HEPN domain
MRATLPDYFAPALDAINAIQSSLTNATLENFTKDMFLRLAVERGLEIVCEASRRVPDGIKIQYPDIDWQRMADFGTHLRCACHRTDPIILWQIAEHHLPPFKNFAESVVLKSGE